MPGVTTMAQRVETTRQSLPYDYLVIALGAEYAPGTISGLEPEAHTFHMEGRLVGIHAAVVWQRSEGSSAHPRGRRGCRHLAGLGIPSREPSLWRCGREAVGQRLEWLKSSRAARGAPAPAQRRPSDDA